MAVTHSMRSLAHILNLGMQVYHVLLEHSLCRVGPFDPLLHKIELVRGYEGSSVFEISLFSYGV